MSVVSNRFSVLFERERHVPQTLVRSGCRRIKARCHRQVACGIAEIALTLICLTPFEMDCHRGRVERQSAAVGFERQERLTVDCRDVAFRNQMLKLSLPGCALVNKYCSHSHEQDKTTYDESLHSAQH